MDPIQIGRTGLEVEWQRLQIIAQNLANMNSTRTEDGDVFRPLRLVSAPDVQFSTMLGNSRLLAGGVHVTAIEAQPDGVRQTYEPEHPHADAQGFVTRPNVDHAREMTLMISTSRAYEANLAMISIAQGMYARALDMGRQQ
jgi:flagellar basal-body rod protein FlgC